MRSIFLVVFSAVFRLHYQGLSVTASMHLQLKVSPEANLVQRRARKAFIVRVATVAVVTSASPSASAQMVAPATAHEFLSVYVAFSLLVS